MSRLDLTEDAENFVYSLRNDPEKGRKEVILQKGSILVGYIMDNRFDGNGFIPLQNFTYGYHSLTKIAELIKGLNDENVRTRLNNLCNKQANKTRRR